MQDFINTRCVVAFRSYPIPCRWRDRNTNIHLQLSTNWQKLAGGAKGLPTQKLGDVDATEFKRHRSATQNSSLHLAANVFMSANSVLKPCRWRRQPRSGKYARMHQLAWAPKLVRDAKGVPTRQYVSPKTCQWCQRDRIWAKKLVGEVTSISHPIQFAVLVC